MTDGTQDGEGSGSVPVDAGDDGARAGDGSGAVVEQLSADAAFELLSNETRLEVLRALFDADGALPFSALNDAVGTRDSGQFNYHLDRLVGAFVRRTDGSYELTAEGRDVVGSLLAGPYTKTVVADPVPVDGDCPACTGGLACFFEEDRVRVGCRKCDHSVIRLAVPPGTFEHYPREEWPLVAERWTRREIETADRGFCPVCSGPTTSEVTTDPTAIDDVFAAEVAYTCRRCGNEQRANVGARLLWHPAVVAFYHERGVDVAGTPVWAFDWAVGPTATVRSEEPPRVEVAIEHEGDRLVLVVGGDAAVVEERRE